MKAITIQANTVSELEKKTTEKIQGDFKPTLAFVFASFTQDLEGISRFFNSLKIQVAGVSTSGEIENRGSFEESISVMLLQIPESYFKLILEEVKEGNIAVAAKNIATSTLNTFKKPGLIIFSGGISLDGQQIVDGIKSNISGEIPLYGGLAGDNLKMQGTYVFNQEKKSDNCLLAVVLDQEKVELHGITTSGWVAVGTEKVVTKSEGNIVYTIDDQPALDVFAKYFGLNKEGIIDVASEIGARFPLQLVREDGSTVLRAPLFAIAENKSLVFAGTVPQGSLVKFSVAPDFDIIEKAIDHVSSYKSSIPQVDAVLMVSCAARKISFGPMVDDEIEGIQKIWNAPLAGFFAYGEIGKKEDASSDFHNETISLITIKEK